MWKAIYKRGSVAASLALLLSLAVAPAAFGAEFYLKAAPTTVTMPNGGPTINMWGFVLTNSSYVPLPGQTVTVPGPRLVVPPGDSALIIHLFNGLPASSPPAETHNISLLLLGPGAPSAVPTWTDGSTGARTSASQRVRSFTQETAPGTSSTYSWSGLQPGTYLYESGTHPSVQVQMGLYGAVTHDFAAGQAYSGVSYANDAIVLFSEIDPALHSAVAAGTYGPPGTGITMTSTMYFEPKYFLINGAPYPNSTLTWNHTPVAGENTLLRFLNAGLETHVPMVQDLYWSIVAEDASPLAYPRQAYNVTLLSGKTTDALLVFPSGGSHSIYDRRLRLTNGTTSNGGMILAGAGGLSAPCVIPPPPAVGPSLIMTKSGTNLVFHWTDIPGATSYQLYQDTTPVPSTFSTLVGTALSGTTGITIPMPAGGPLYYLLNAVNGCAIGPQR